MTVETDDGRRVSFDSAKYAYISHGYAVTTHKAQGVTVQHSFVLGGGAMTNREMAYVQMSRHKESARLYLNKKEVIDRLKSQSPDLAPTEKMLNYVKFICSKSKIDLPEEVKESFWVCREWLNQNSDKVYDGKKEDQYPEFEDIKEVIQKMSNANQKDTTLDYEVDSNINSGTMNEDKQNDEQQQQKQEQEMEL